MQAFFAIPFAGNAQFFDGWAIIPGLEDSIEDLLGVFLLVFAALGGEVLALDRVPFGQTGLINEPISHSEVARHKVKLDFGRYISLLENIVRDISL